MRRSIIWNTWWMYEFLYSSLLYKFFYAIKFLLYEKYGMLHTLCHKLIHSRAHTNTIKGKVVPIELGTLTLFNFILLYSNLYWLDCQNTCRTPAKIVYDRILKELLKQSISLNRITRRYYYLLEITDL